MLTYSSTSESLAISSSSTECFLSDFLPSFSFTLSFWMEKGAVKILNQRWHISCAKPTLGKTDLLFYLSESSPSFLDLSRSVSLVGRSLTSSAYSGTRGFAHACTSYIPSSPGPTQNGWGLFHAETKAITNLTRVHFCLFCYQSFSDLS